jgi:hypothetical protein
MTTTDFTHQMAAHCETGTICALMANAGAPLSEPMVFGIGGGIFFGYLKTPSFPFPMIVTRTEPGKIRKKIQKRLGADFKTRTFRNIDKAEAALDELLGKGIPTAVQVDMFYMDYIPDYMRAHFNGHYVVVLGRQEDTYRVSDVYYPRISELSAQSMRRGRFARGQLAPKGFLFYPRKIVPTGDLRKPIIAGIKEACFNMLSLPIPFLGVRGIRTFAKKVVTWPTLARDEDHLSHEIMMINVTLEDRGTGGAGFRFMYATFLQQASEVLGAGALAELSQEMMGIGDRWREISIYTARMGKARDFGSEKFQELREMILARADEEERFFKALRKAIK